MVRQENQDLETDLKQGPHRAEQDVTYIGTVFSWLKFPKISLTTHIVALVGLRKWLDLRKWGNFFHKLNFYLWDLPHFSEIIYPDSHVFCFEETVYISMFYQFLDKITENRHILMWGNSVFCFQGLHETHFPIIPQVLNSGLATLQILTWLILTTSK